MKVFALLVLIALGGVAIGELIGRYCTFIPYWPRCVLAVVIGAAMGAGGYYIIIQSP